MARRLAAILAADVVGYSKLMAEDEAGTLAALKAHRHDLFNPATSRHGGRIVKVMGDGALVEFPSVVDAVECAVAVQQVLAASGGNIRLRIGINLGDVIIDGEDIYGDGVNVAARLEALAEPGGIAISGMVHEGLGNRVEAAFSDGGEQQVKNIARPIRVWRWSPGQKAVPPTASSGPALPGKPSIAVLPFDNMSGDPEQEYFADGITEDIITELARNRGLFVIARNSTFTFKGISVDIAEVGRKLGVRYVVEGSVRKGGNRVRITAQLIEAATGSHVWAERYDRDLEDIFAVQDEVTRSIVVAVPGHLESDIVKASRRKPTESLGAYEHYLRGIEIAYRWRNDEIPQAMAEFESAVKLDPNFARAHALLGYMHIRKWWQTQAPQHLQRADEATGLAVRLDSRDSRCVGFRAVYLMLAKNFDAASDAFQRALQLSPDDADINDMMAYFLLCMGRADEAIERSRKAMRASPLFHPASLHETIGMAYMMARQYEEAIKSFAAISSPYYYIHVYLAGCLTKLGHRDEARMHARLASELNPDWRNIDWGYQYTKAEYSEHEREIAQLAAKALED